MGAADVYAFLAERGRLPRLGDETPPWRYRGVLLPYVQGAHTIVPETANRWAWWLDVVAERTFPPGPIPRVHFSTRCAGRGQGLAIKNIESCCRILDEGSSPWESFRLLCEWLAFALAVRDEPPQLEERIHEALYRTLNLEPWLTTPGDHLGEYLSSVKASGWNPTGFYPTPHAICEMIAQITFAGWEAVLPDGRDGRLATVCDPAVGTGRLLMHASNYSIRLFGQDIDPLPLLILKINAALMVPWMAFPLPAEALAELSARRYPPGQTPPGLEEADERAVIEIHQEVGETLATLSEEMRAVVEVEGARLLTDRRGQGLLFPVD